MGIYLLKSGTLEREGWVLIRIVQENISGEKRGGAVTGASPHWRCHVVFICCIPCCWFHRMCGWNEGCTQAALYCLICTEKSAHMWSTYVHGNVCSLVRAISFQNVHPAVSSAVTFSPVVSLKLCCNLREPRRLQSFGLSSLSVALVSSMIIAALLLHSIDPKTNSCLNELSAIKFPPIHSFLQVIHFLLSPYQPEKEERVSWISNASSWGVVQLPCNWQSWEKGIQYSY